LTPRSETGIFGRAINSTGEPVTRFRVVLSAASFERPSLALVYDPSSIFAVMPYTWDIENDIGIFSITDVPAGSYKLAIQSLPHSPMEQTRYVALGTVNLRSGLVYGEILAQFPRMP
jgi:hypothetical protein